MSDKKPQPKKPIKKKLNLVKMINEAGLKADVHPDMVEDYKTGGYKLVKD